MWTRLRGALSTCTWGVILKMFLVLSVLVLLKHMDKELLEILLTIMSSGTQAANPSECTLIGFNETTHDGIYDCHAPPK